MTRPQHLDLSSKLTHLAFHPRSLPTEKPQTSHVTPERDQTGHGEQLHYNDGVGNPRDVVNKVRPVLETYCRNLYPSQFADADMLGAIVGKIQTAGAAHPPLSIAEDLYDRTVYSRQYHDGENPHAAIEPISHT